MGKLLGDMICPKLAVSRASFGERFLSTNPLHLFHFSKTCSRLISTLMDGCSFDEYFQLTDQLQGTFYVATCTAMLGGIKVVLN